VASKFGCDKVCLVLHLDANPGDSAEAMAAAIETLGLSLTAINAKGKKQVAFTRKALEGALAGHARARFGTTTELLERPAAKLHGPVSHVRIRTPVLADDGTRPREERFAPVVQVFWALGGKGSVPGRSDLDRFIAALSRAVPVRVGAAGLVWAGIERPMAKDARAVAGDMLAAMLARPHAHSNHRALLDTTRAALEPGFWNFLGPKHLARLGNPDAAAAFRTHFAASGASFALFDEAPIEATREVVDAHAGLARFLGPLYPPAAVSEIVNGISIPKAAGFGLSRWLARYRDEDLLERVTAGVR
jgi:hypothetical protein